MRYGNDGFANHLQISCKFNLEFGGTNKPIQKFHTKKFLVTKINFCARTSPFPDLPVNSFSS